MKGIHLFTPYRVEIDQQHAVVIRDEADGHMLLRLHPGQAAGLGWKLVDVAEMLPEVPVDDEAVMRAIHA
jgi:hypothetical protein